MNVGEEIPWKQLLSGGPEVLFSNERFMLLLAELVKSGAGQFRDAFKSFFLLF